MNRSPIKLIYGRLLNKLKTVKMNQQGLALPIVLAIVAIGATAITPFLTHAASNLLSMGVYEQIADERYAADAGVEQAIWNLTDGTLVSQLAANGGTVSYSLGYQVNTYTPALTVTQTGGGGGAGTAGTITSESQFSPYKFASNGVTPEIINVSGDIFALVYRDGQNGMITLKTFNITTGGVITLPAVAPAAATLTIAAGYEPDIVSLASGYFAIVYRGASDKGYIRTVQISAAGAITSKKSATYNNNIYNNYNPRIIHTTGNYYAVAYCGASYTKGYLQTLLITTTGDITNSAVSTYNYPAAGLEPSLIWVGGNYCAVAYRDASNHGNLVTININSSGIITKSIFNSLQFSSSDSFYPDIISVGGTIYGLVSGGASSAGYLTTVSISSSGVITNHVIDSQVFDATWGYTPHMIPVSGNVYAIIFQGAAADGWLRTWTIDADGSIAASQVDFYEFDTSNGNNPFLIHVNGSVYAAVYQSSHSNAWVFTLTITTKTSNSYSIQSVAGGTTTTASVAIDNNIVTLSQWQISR